MPVTPWAPGAAQVRRMVTVAPAGGGGIPSLQDAVGYWKMEQATGATRIDSTGNSDLADNNSVAQATGILGNCGQYTASSSMYLSHADNASLSVGSTNYTIVCWWQISDKSASRVVVAKGTGFTKTTVEYCVWYNQPTDRISFSMYSPTDYLMRKLDNASLGAPALNTWYFTVVRESSAGAIDIRTNMGTLTSSTVSAPVDGAGVFTIGGFPSGGGMYWNGLIDTVGIWKRLLSDADLNLLYAAGVGADAY